MNNSSATAEDNASILAAFNIVTFVLGLFAMITNGVLIIITMLDPLKSFQRSSNLFIISLAVSDFLTGVVSCLFALNAKISQDKIFIKSVTIPIWISVQNSVLTIFLMAIERLIVIKYPLNARLIVTKSRTKLLIVLAWMLSILLGSITGIPPPYDQYAKLGFIIECMIIVITMLLIYIRIALLLKRRFRQFSGKKLCGRHRGGSKSGVESPKEQRNLNFVVFSLAVILCVTVIPYWLIGFYYIGYQISCSFTCNVPTNLVLLVTIAFSVELLNFVVNPLIYAWRLPAYRRAILYYLGNKKRYRNRPSFTSVRTNSRIIREDTQEKPKNDDSNDSTDQINAKECFLMLNAEGVT